MANNEIKQITLNAWSEVTATSGVSWVNPSNAMSSDDSWAVATGSAIKATTNYLVGVNSSATAHISPDSIITGLRSRVEGNETVFGQPELWFYPWWNGSLYGNYCSAIMTNGASDGQTTCGSATFNHSASTTPNMVNAAGWGMTLFVPAMPGANNVSIDEFVVFIYHDSGNMMMVV